MPQTFRHLLLAFWDEQLLFFIYTNRWAICVLCARLLRLVVQFSIVTMVLGLVNYPLATFPLPFPHNGTFNGMLYILGTMAILLVLRELSVVFSRQSEAKAHKNATLDSAEQQEHKNRATGLSETFSIVEVIETCSPGIAVEEIIDASTSEGEGVIPLGRPGVAEQKDDKIEDITLCDSMLTVVGQLPRKKDAEGDWQVILTPSPEDEDDEIFEISIDIKALLMEEETAIRLRQAADKKEIECRRLERIALEAFDNDDAQIGRQMLSKRDELIQEVIAERKKASEHMFRYHNPTYTDTKAGLTRLDLHGLYPDEAESRIIAHLSMCRKRSMKQTRIITGKGRHSIWGKPVLKPLTLRLLQIQTDLSFMLQPGNAGMVVVRFDPQSVGPQM